MDKTCAAGRSKESEVSTPIRPRSVAAIGLLMNLLWEENEARQKYQQRDPKHLPGKVHAQLTRWTAKPLSIMADLEDGN